MNAYIVLFLNKSFKYHLICIELLSLLVLNYSLHVMFIPQEAHPLWQRICLSAAWVGYFLLQNSLSCLLTAASKRHCLSYFSTTYRRISGSEQTTCSVSVSRNGITDMDFQCRGSYSNTSDLEASSILEKTITLSVVNGLEYFNVLILLFVVRCFSPLLCK